MHTFQMERMIGESKNNSSIVKEMHFKGVEKISIICTRLKAIIGDIEKHFYGL